MGVTSLLSLRTVGIGLVVSSLILAGCNANGSQSAVPIIQASPLAKGGTSRFLTRDLPSEQVTGARTISLKDYASKLPGAIHADVSSTATETSITFFSTLQDSSYSWLEYNIQVDYSDGTSVIAYAPDGNSLLVRNPDKSSTVFDVEFTNQSGNVFLTMEKTNEIAAPTPPPTPAPTPVHPSKTPPPCTGKICFNAAPAFVAGAHKDVSCTAVAALAGAFGYVLGAAATEGTFITAGTIVGAFLGPGGMAAGAEIGAYAATALGAEDLGAMVGGSVVAALADSICESFTPTGAGHYAGNGNGPPDYNTPTIPAWPTTPIGVSGGPSTFSSCCYPTPAPGQSEPN